MGNIGERPGMHQGRGAFQGLHQIRLDGILHQHGQGTGNPQVFSRDSGTLAVGTDNHAPEALAHVAQVGGERQDGHDLAGNGDVKARAASLAFLFRTKTDLDLAQEAVIGIHDTPPGDGTRINIQAGEATALFWGQVVRVQLVDAQLLQATQHGRRELALAFFVQGAKGVKEFFVILLTFMEHTGINGGSTQVIGCGDGVDVAGEVQVEVFHGNDLRVTTPGRAALDAKGGTLGRLANGSENFLPQVGTQGLGKPNRGGGFALPQRCGGDGGHIDILAIGNILKAFKDLQFYLGFIRTVKFQFFGQDADFISNLGDRFDVRGLGDVYIRGHRADNFQLGGDEWSGHRDSLMN